LIAYAAIDLRGGRVVQLVGGQPEQERVSLPDPAAVARQWLHCGFRALHVVDLDAALGRGDNGAAVLAVITAAAGVPVQVGGGVRTTERARTLIEGGADRIVVGTRAVQERAWLEDLAAEWPGRVVVAADVLGEEVVVKGWTAGAGISVESFLGGLADVPLAAVLVTDVQREGRMTGADTVRFRHLAELSPHPVLASGGIASAADLRDLARAGIAGAVLGMALYTGALDGGMVAREFAA
jgi:phosphoribosylformimino-5-aminoimidazole carboxamide ribotide isomerase